MSVTGPQEDEGPKRGPPDWKRILMWVGIIIAVIIAMVLLFVAYLFVPILLDALSDRFFARGRVRGK